MGRPRRAQTARIDACNAAGAHAHRSASLHLSPHALDFGPLAGDQPGGEGTGKALGINDDSLFAVFGIVIGFIFFNFNQWQSYQDDDEDFFDVYDSRRIENSDSRNRDLQRDGGKPFRGA